MAALTRIEADYWIETPIDPRECAETMAATRPRGKIQ